MQSKLVGSSLELISPVTLISCFDEALSPSLSLSLPPSLSPLSLSPSLSLPPFPLSLSPPPSLPFPSLSNFMFTHQ